MSDWADLLGVVRGHGGLVAGDSLMGRRFTERATIWSNNLDYLPSNLPRGIVLFSNQNGQTVTDEFLTELFTLDDVSELISIALEDRGRLSIETCDGIWMKYRFSKRWSWRPYYDGWIDE